MRLSAPAEKHRRLLQAADGTQHAARHLFPAESLVRIGAVGFNGQHRIEQQHALFCPCRQVAALRKRTAGIAVQLLEDIAQRRRQLDAGRHRKGQPHRLTRLVIRILSGDHRAHVLRSDRAERVQDVLLRGIDHLAAVAHDLYLVEQFAAHVGCCRLEQTQPRVQVLAVLFIHASSLRSSAHR